MQANFVAEVIDRLAGLHVVLDTSGYAEASAFSAVAGRCDLIFFDLKLVDPVAHRRWTGQDNGPILRNLALLEQLERPFVARIPLVPGVTDSLDNLEAIASTLEDMTTLLEVQLLPYNRAAGGKYAACGLNFEPGFDEERLPNADMEPFRRMGIEVRVA
jgi:pyruvate formate lyase activating enzyme